MHTLTLTGCFLALSSAFLLYGLSYDTRFVELRVQTAERIAERVRSEIAILRAERAYLARPERLEPLARARGLRPTEPGQISGPFRSADADDAAR